MWLVNILMLPLMVLSWCGPTTAFLFSSADPLGLRPFSSAGSSHSLGSLRRHAMGLVRQNPSVGQRILTNLDARKGVPVLSKPQGDGSDGTADSGAEKEFSAMKKGLDREFFGIAFPAFVQFMAEPLASLVDTVYIGRLGPAALGGVGVAISAQYSVSKLYNDPLLRTSISLVASGAGKAQASGEL